MTHSEAQALVSRLLVELSPAEYARKITTPLTRSMAGLLEIRPTIYDWSAFQSWILEAIQILEPFTKKTEALDHGYQILKAQYQNGWEGALYDFSQNKSEALTPIETQLVCGVTIFQSNRLLQSILARYIPDRWEERNFIAAAMLAREDLQWPHEITSMKSQFLAEQIENLITLVYENNKEIASFREGSFNEISGFCKSFAHAGEESL